MATAVFGLAYAARLRRTHPDRYQRLGTRHLTTAGPVAPTVATAGPDPAAGTPTSTARLLDHSPGDRHA
ncbi:hypothetical protein GCM10023084_34990 [Streptomyces lacrimifluminis]|uniref:Uncharacterized protein n=1 Tax=Streptomyces lacrimifluminis TaxID=1500077 RepID=A0A917L1L2_9ACTN|nr:hypothetical protein [Streptomyces lacrimifluminis]GGJ38425.1 hypothetical protein GCM10012282_38970 [Streptomyces lacrimifluminis]